MVYLDVRSFVCYNKCQKTNALIQLTNKEYAPSSFSNDKAYRRTPYVSQKDPKAKGTYLAITESYYDKEKKATRQKTIMGLGYLEDLKKDYPDPISHFEKVVADMNQEREAKKNSVVYVDLTTALSPENTLIKM